MATVSVRIPGTSANIGPGFDCLGIAFNLYNRFSFEEIEGPNRFSGFAPQYCNNNNMVYTAMLETFKELGRLPKGLHIGVEEEVPVSRGLGSSAACIVGGVCGANGLAGNPLTKDDILTIASRIEGHPDNIAPAVYGGMTVAVEQNGQFFAQRVQVAPGLSFYAMIPDFHLGTKEARGALPKTIPYRDGVHNVGRAAMLLAVMTGGRFELLEMCLDDKLHQPYRKRLIPGFDRIFEACRKSGAYGTFLSGAGPTLMAIVSQSNLDFEAEMKAFLKNLPHRHRWRILPLEMDTRGAVVDVDVTE